MKKAFVIIVYVSLLLFFTLSCQAVNRTSPKPKEVKGDGTKEETSIAYKNLRGVSLEAFGEAYLEISKNEGIRIEGDENLLDTIQTDVKNGILHIKLKPGVTIIATRPIQFYVRLANLEEVSLPGSGLIELQSDLESDQLHVNLAGSGEIYLSSIHVKDLRIDLPGSGSIKTAGSSDRQTITLAGSGIYDGVDLVSNTTDIDLTGSGTIQVHANKELNVRLSGSGNIQYQGDASLHQEISGSGSVEKIK